MLRALRRLSTDIPFCSESTVSWQPSCESIPKNRREASRGWNPHDDTPVALVDKDSRTSPSFHQVNLAGLTEPIKLSTGILILPQRQTALVAKQAAEADALSGGRLRLGVGVGWNRIEFEALGAEFEGRGRRMEEQVAVLRALWTEELVTFGGNWHTINNVGLNPMPVQRPIPIWFGGHADAVLERIGRLGDGWIISPNSVGPEHVASKIERIRAVAREAGRDPASIGIETWVRLEERPIEAWLEEVRKWQATGVEEIALNTQRSGCASVADHIAALERCKEVFDSI